MAIGRIDGTQAEVAEQIGVAESSLSKWQSGKGRASLAGVVRLCAAGQWSVAEFLQGRLTYAPGPSSTRPSPWRGRVRKNWSALERRARMRATRVPPPTLRQLADDLRVDIRGLRKELPDLASGVVQTRQAWAADQAQRRLADATALIEATVQRLLDEGLNPSRRAVEGRLPKPFLLREPALQAVWKRARSSR